ncbi:MAG TPA: hypothetical protein V6D25_07970 [Leptolyngbyaceae cyanobacterium]
MKENTPLFTEIYSEESAAVSGGRRVSFDWNTYFFILGAGVLLGNPGLTPDEVHFAWMNSFVFEDDTTSDISIGVGSLIRRNSIRSIYF